MGLARKARVMSPSYVIKELSATARAISPSSTSSQTGSPASTECTMLDSRPTSRAIWVRRS
jgi:hypothetical protein